MTARLTCENCGAEIPAEHLADADGERLFGCCACGLATVEFSFPSEIATSPPGGVNWRGISLGENVVSFSCS